jgi:hypothetical protein
VGAEGKSARRKVDLNTDAMSLDLTDAELGQVPEVAAQAMGAELAVDERLASRKITVARQGVPMRALLDEVCRLGGCAWKLESGVAPRLVVMPRS